MFDFFNDFDRIFIEKHIFLTSFSLKLSLLQMSLILSEYIEVSNGAEIRNRYNQVPHLTQNTNGKVTNSQLDTTN